MGFRTTAVLLGVVGLLILMLVWTQAGPVGTGAVFEPVLGGQRLASARRIVIDHEGAPSIVLELGDDDRFWMVEPVRDLASSAVLRSLAGSYETATRMVAYTPEEIESDPRLMRETGLDVPRARIRFEFPAGPTVDVNLGEEAPLGQEVFLGMGDTIYRSGLDLFTVLDTNVDDMRERLDLLF